MKYVILFIWLAVQQYSIGQTIFKPGTVPNFQLKPGANLALIIEDPNLNKISSCTVSNIDFDSDVATFIIVEKEVRININPAIRTVGNIKVNLKYSYFSNNSKNIKSEEFLILIKPEILEQENILFGPIGEILLPTDKLFYNLKIDTTFENDRKIINIYLSGKTIEFSEFCKEEYVNLLKYNKNKLDVSETSSQNLYTIHNLFIYAEELIIKDTLWLPGYNIFIYTSNISILSSGQLDVSPAPLPCVYNNEPCNPRGKYEKPEIGDYKLINGLNSGNINLFTSTYSFQSNSNSPSIILKGGNGGMGYVNNEVVDWSIEGLPLIGPNEGYGDSRKRMLIPERLIPASSATDYFALDEYCGKPNYNNFKEDLKSLLKSSQILRWVVDRSSTETVEAYKNIEVLWSNNIIEVLNNTTNGVYGNNTWLSNGKRKVRIIEGNARECINGGIGGKGGVFTTNIEDIYKYANIEGGMKGKQGKLYYGGNNIENLPIQDKYLTLKIHYAEDLCGRNLAQYVEIIPHPIVPGGNCTPSEGEEGEKGSYIFDNRSFVSFQWVKHSINYAKDLFLHRHNSEAKASFEKLKIALNTIEPAHSDYYELSVCKNEVNTYLSRLDNGLDYYGMIQGWVPNVDLLALISTYSNDISTNLNFIQFASNIEKNQSNIALRNKNIESLQKEIQNLTSSYYSDIKDINQNINAINVQLNSIASKEHSLTVKLNDRKVELEAIANSQHQDNLRNAKKAKRLGQLISVAKMFPIGQPYLGVAGSLVEGYNKYKSDGDIFPFIETISQGTSALSATGNPSQDYFDNFRKLRDSWEKVEKIDYKNIKNYINENKKNLSNVYDPMINTLNEFNRLKETTSLGSGEIENIYKSLIATDPEFNKYLQDFEELMETKQNLYNSIVKLETDVLEIKNKFEVYVLQYEQLQNEKINNSSKFISSTLGNQLDVFKKYSFDNLLKYQYYIAKAYEYSSLKPYNNRFITTQSYSDITSKIEEIIPNSNDFYASATNMILSDLREDIIVSGPKSIFTKKIKLNSDQLRNLNNSNECKFEIELGDILSSFPNMIYDIRIESIEMLLDYEGGSVSNATVSKNNKTIISDEVNNYAFYHINNDKSINDATLIFSLTNKGDNSKLLKTVPQASLTTLFGVPSSEVITKPGIIGTYSVAIIEDIPQATNLKNVDINLTFSFRINKRFGSHKYLYISNNNLFETYINTDVDVIGNSLGTNSFIRVYPNNTDITISSPKFIDQYKFSHWLDDNSNKKYRKNTIKISMLKNQIFSPIYVKS